MIDKPNFENHLSFFDISNPKLIERTALAEIHCVQRRDGSPAILKVWQVPNNEQAGVDYLQALNGNGAVRVLARGDGAILMELLDGPSLGETTRQGHDSEASEILAKVAVRLLKTPKPDLPDLPTVEHWCRALFQTGFAPDCDPTLRANIEYCRPLARHLLDTSPPAAALHGDLHHDNVLAHNGDWIAIDPKGLRGDPCYDLANAMRNPKGAAALLRDPAIITTRADIFAAALKVTRQRMLQWAAVKTALSICWRGKGAVKQDRESDLLAIFLSLAA